LTAVGGPDGSGIAICADASTVWFHEAIYLSAPRFVGIFWSQARRDVSPMRSLTSLLRFTPARLRRRLAQIAEIAAASLPTAGA
jgi:hypothetical protein